MNRPAATSAARIRPVVAAAVVLVLLTSSNLWATATPRAAQPAGVRVHYISLDHIYVDGGTANGLALGDTLAVERGAAQVAMLEIVYAAEHSASCRVLSAISPIKTGDLVRPLATLATPARQASRSEPTAPIAAKPATEPVLGGSPGSSSLTQTPARPAVSRHQGPAAWGALSGYAALQWCGFDDRGPADLDYDQPALRFHLKSRRLWGKPFVFEARGRFQRDFRVRTYGEGAPASEWSNRVYSLYLAYGDPGGAWSWRLGRVIANPIVATGPVDGALVEARLSERVRAGAFGGALPDWRDTTPRAGLQKYGLYVRAEHGDPADRGGQQWAGSLAGAFETHGRTVSRQYLALQGQWQSGWRWNVYELAELDLNGGWRRAKAPADLSLTNLYLSGGWRPTRAASFGLTYDTRRNVRTWDTRSVLDALYDDTVRQGLRAQAALGLLSRWHAFASGGWRGRHGGGDDTWSWSGGLSRDGSLDRGINITAQVAGFNGPVANGLYPSLLVRKPFRAGHDLGLSLGTYRTRLASIPGRRLNSWLRLDGTRRLSPRLYLAAQYEHDWGDDVRGERLMIEAGLEF